MCRRLLMMGCTNSELWNNLGLCCFYASQYDMTVRCFENALLVADDMAQADIWCAHFCCCYVCTATVIYAALA